ncbi:MAG: class I SAM-dependent methyltransferase [Fimbriimonadaceae bacterium]|nr:class I SAM-dependent methyltransferase [Fimbriimonadaceae bacterium]
MSDERQPLAAQRGEIAFRAKLVRQQVAGERLFDDEFDAAGIEAILAERMTDTVATLRRLQAAGVPLPGFLELGAERGQRSLALVNEFGEPGLAVDLSLDMLQSCAHWATRFALATLPLRLVADANRLPLRSGSLPLVFCYQTLHHFPDPAPIVAECARLLAPGGWFYFAEEPVLRRLRCRLYQAPAMYSTAGQGASRLRQKLDSFCAWRVCNETEHGVIENDDIPLATWRRALAPFDRRQVTVTTIRQRQVDLFAPGDGWGRLLAGWFGGQVQGLCRKPGELAAGAPLPAALVCPDCLAAGAEQPLTAGAEHYQCAACGTSFPVAEGVLVLLPTAQRQALYPQLG